jgi:hypothetical protein
MSTWCRGRATGSTLPSGAAVPALLATLLPHLGWSGGSLVRPAGASTSSFARRPSPRRSETRRHPPTVGARGSGGGSEGRIQCTPTGLGVVARLPTRAWTAVPGGLFSATKARQQAGRRSSTQYRGRATGTTLPPGAAVPALSATLLPHLGRSGGSLVRPPGASPPSLARRTGSG